MKTETSTEPKPSELAMKAAIALFPRGYSWGAKDKNEQVEKAQIIDRETNLPELLKQRDALKTALLILLDQVDYTNGACRQNSMIGAALETRIINKARESLALCDKQ